MFGFVDQRVAEAAGTGDLKAVQEYLDVNPHQLDNRTLFQSNLLHIAARNGQAAIVEELMHRGSNLDALDYGGMRRTALHWACQGGHVRIVELLVDHGANTQIWCSHDMLQQQQQQEQQQVQGKAWSMLVQGKRCGRLIDQDTPFEDSPISLCSNYSVRLALERPAWTPDIHYMFPPRFKDMVRLMLLFQHSGSRTPLVESTAGARHRQAPGCSEPLGSGALGELLTDQLPAGQQLPAHARKLPAHERESQQLDWDCLRDIFGLSAYPISSWM